MTDLVVLSLESWDHIWRRNQYLIAGLLAKDEGRRVLFVEPAADPAWDVVQGRRPRRGDGLQAVDGVPGVPAGRLWRLERTKILPARLDRGQERRLSRAVRRAAARLGFTRPILWVNDPHGASVVRDTGWPALYDVTDDWLAAERAPDEHERLVRDETTLLRECAEVVVCSQALVASKGAARPVTLVPNAVDTAFYRAPAPRPGDLPEGPVALYVGTVHRDRMDLELCIRTARALGNRARFVIVGPVLLDGADRDRLRSAGVVLLGSRDRRSVPAYLQHADVLVVPHVVDAFTDTLDPIKLYEYRAVGRPVVSTPVAGFRDHPDELTTVGVGAEFVAAVRGAVPARTRFPDGVSGRDVPTWADRVSQMEEVIDRMRRGAMPS